MYRLNLYYPNVKCDFFEKYKLISCSLSEVLNFLGKVQNYDLNIKISRIDHKYEENTVWKNRKVATN